MELLLDLPLLKGHDNEADFQGFLQNSVPHRSLTLRAVPILASNSQRYSLLKNDSPTRRLSDSAFE